LKIDQHFNHLGLYDNLEAQFMDNLVHACFNGGDISQ